MTEQEESFREFVRGRLSSLYRVAYLLTGDRHLAEDLVQSALVKVARHWKRVVAADDPEAYVRRVLYNQHVSWWRRRRVVADPYAVPPEHPGPDTTAAVAVSVDVRRALARLAPRQRAVLVLRYLDDLSEAQTAEVLGCSVGTVKSQARDALARLRRVAPELRELVGEPR